MGEGHDSGDLVRDRQADGHHGVPPAEEEGVQQGNRGGRVEAAFRKVGQEGESGIIHYGYKS